MPLVRQRVTVHGLRGRMPTTSATLTNAFADISFCFTRDALGHKKSNGERVGNIEYGYRLARDGKHVEPDFAEQTVLKEIGRLRAGDGTLRGIAAALNGRALRTRRGTAWRHQHIARVIKRGARRVGRSEEHTSELQSLRH